ncbi:hypothetical protein UlMin_023629 [Ulmus minor]
MIWCFVVHGIEYAFGAHEYLTNGIFDGEPKHCEGFTFNKTILIGKTYMEIAKVYKGNAYNLITKNYIHFCNDACIRLIYCNCTLPKTLN